LSYNLCVALLFFFFCSSHKAFALYVEFVL